MTRRVASWLRRLAEWLDPTPVPVVPDVGPVMARIRTLVREADQLAQGTSGAYKKWAYVHARIVKEHPALSRRDVNLWIEQVVSE